MKTAKENMKKNPTNHKMRIDRLANFTFNPIGIKDVAKTTGNT